MLLSVARAVLVGRAAAGGQVLRVEVTPKRPVVAAARLDHALGAGRPRAGSCAPLGGDRWRREAGGAFRERESPAGSRYQDLEFFNGLGGFAEGGREYVIVLGPGQATPAPWINVVANPTFGFQVSESGAGYTWAENSRENQLTPWSNDPVGDPVGEALYLRDDDSGESWGPTAQPIRCEDDTYVARHGPGYSRFEHLHDGIGLDLVQFVALDDPVKLSLLSVENRSSRAATCL